jgi:hypothetical protein
VLSYGRIQIFLDSHPEKSGFLRFVTTWVVDKGRMLLDKSGLSPGNHWLPGLDHCHLWETTGFPDLTIVIFGKPLASRT